MVSRIRFRKEDIGGEILPILTSGLYRNRLDTLREYIQNAIDAHCERIEIVIDPDTIMVDDDGDGMTLDEARKAIRLGISEKSPLEYVGFRGIGIYSAFNICNRIDIYTRSTEEDACYVIHFDFERIRNALLDDQVRRKQGEASSLYLEGLLERAIYVDVDGDNTLVQKGTRAIMSGLLGEVYQELNDWDQVVDYLQGVVPLPFSENFRYASEIQEKFREEDYRVVPLILQIGRRRENVCRPYYNEVFAHGGEHPPAFFDIALDKHRFGFAWVCINDARHVLRDIKLRGLIIKKFDFSISTRSYLEPYFPRPVFNRRITGEIIIQHPDLIPNAARSDFEHNSTRQSFIRALPRFIWAVSDWANRIQEEDKAKEVLVDMLYLLREINDGFPSEKRDKERLLNRNIELDYVERQIKGHQRILKRIIPDELEFAQTLLKECKDFVKSALLAQRKSQTRIEQQVVRSIQRGATLPSETETERLKDIPKSIVALVESYGLAQSNEIAHFLQFLDDNYLRSLLSADDYEEMLEGLQEYLEGLP